MVLFHTLPCPLCGRSSTLELDYTAFHLWRSGTHVQDAFPKMSPDQRELLITGTHPQCWDKMFPEEEEDDYGRPIYLHHDNLVN